MYLQSIKSVKQKAAKSINRSTERKADKGFGVFIVHSSMRITISVLFGENAMPLPCSPTPVIGVTVFE